MEIVWGRCSSEILFLAHLPMVVQWPRVIRISLLRHLHSLNKSQKRYSASRMQKKNQQNSNEMPTKLPIRIKRTTAVPTVHGAKAQTRSRNLPAVRQCWADWASSLVPIPRSLSVFYSFFINQVSLSWLIFFCDQAKIWLHFSYHLAFSPFSVCAVILVHILPVFNSSLVHLDVQLLIAFVIG